MVKKERQLPVIELQDPAGLFPCFALSWQPSPSNDHDDQTMALDWRLEA